MLKNDGKCSLCRQLLIISSLLTFTYTAVFILLGVGCLYVMYLANGDLIIGKPL